MPGSRFSHRRFRAARAYAGLSRIELATRVERSVSLVIAVEHGRTTPSVTTLERAADALGVEVGDFFEQRVDAVAPLAEAAL
jgi:transcriptional regulator with XRE-family HTH domain